MPRDKTWRPRYRERIRAYLAQTLGDTCAECGQQPVEYAHRDRDTKRFSMSKAIEHKWADVVDEAAKCRPLCRPCHIAETLANQDWRPLDPDVKATRVYRGSKGRNRTGAVRSC